MSFLTNWTQRSKPEHEPTNLEAAANEPSASVEAMIGTLIVPAIVVGSDNRIAALNVRAREYFPSLQNDQPLHLVSRHPGLLDAVARAREQGVTQTGEIVDRPAGQRRMVVTVSPISATYNQDKQTLLLIQFRDLTEQDRLAQSRSDFIANASHELRTPLASLKGFIETLQGPASGDATARHRFLGIMEAQAARMARILDDLLSLSRIEMRAHMAPSGTVDVARIVREAADGLEPIAREAKISIKLESKVPSAMVRGDRDELLQVFQNLIENAIKYGRSGGHVDVRIERRDEGRPRIAVIVTDDGPGIADMHLPRLTERFYRVDTATSRERGGTGLGLAIVKHILNRHKGELSITSTLGTGSTFTVLLEALPETQ